MPIILNTDGTRLYRQGAGWAATTLADKGTIGVPALVARRWTFEPGAEGPWTTHGEVDQLIYVISGSGLARVNAISYPLQPESVLWLEPGDIYRFEAGPDGMEILQGYAPGE